MYDVFSMKWKNGRQSWLGFYPSNGEKKAEFHSSFKAFKLEQEHKNFYKVGVQSDVFFFILIKEKNVKTDGYHQYCYAIL